MPWFGLFTTLGFAAAAVALWRSTARLRWLTMIGGVLALVGVVASLVAIGYLVTGTIPESTNAPAAVGGSYIVLSAAAFLSLLVLGVVIAANRSLAAGWRWLPLGLLAAQFPIFIIAGAIGDTIGSENVTAVRSR